MVELISEEFSLKFPYNSDALAWEDNFFSPSPIGKGLG